VEGSIKMSAHPAKNVTSRHWSEFKNFRNVKLILKVLSDLKPFRGSSNKKTLYSTRSCVNWAFFGTRGPLKRSLQTSQINYYFLYYRMIKKSLDQGCRGINKLSMKLFISIICLTTFKLAGYKSKCLKENIKMLLLNHITVIEIVVKMVIGFICLVYV
jgi:hypothetical protein